MVEDDTTMKGEGAVVRHRGEPMVVVYEAVGVSGSGPWYSVFSFFFRYWFPGFVVVWLWFVH